LPRSVPLTPITADVTAQLRRDLEGIVGARRVSVDPVDRDVYARDMWPRLLLARRAGESPQRLPDVIVWPESVREVAAIVKLARQAGVPIVPYGGGSGVCGGAVPRYGGITIDTKRMVAIRSVSDDEMVCDVDAGIIGERFERELARRGYTFGHFPSSIYCSTVGGWLATRAAGQLSTKYGKVEDRVVGVTVVTGRGEIVETDGPTRALRGPNWTQLMVGSEGTLGVITSARLRVSPAPQLRVMRGYWMPDVATGLEAIRSVMQRGLRPAVVRLYDELDTMLAGGGAHALGAGPDTRDAIAPEPLPGAGPLPRWPSAAPPPSGVFDRLRGLARARASSAPRDLLGAALERPGLVNTVLGAAAQRVRKSGCRMIIGLEGARIRTEVEAALTFAELDAAGGTDLGDEPGLAWLEHRYAVSYKMSGVFIGGSFVDTMEVATTWDRLPTSTTRGARRRSPATPSSWRTSPTPTATAASIYFTFAATPTTTRGAQRGALRRDLGRR
jgi:alkyldihydroxyacetonephosphate synthase